MKNTIDGISSKLDMMGKKMNGLEGVIVNDSSWNGERRELVSYRETSRSPMRNDPKARFKNVNVFKGQLGVSAKIIPTWGEL